MAKRIKPSTRSANRSSVGEDRDEINEIGSRLFHLTTQMKAEKERLSERKGIGDLKRLDEMQAEHKELKRRHANLILKRGKAGKGIPRST